MKVSYDKERDIAYIQFSTKRPDGAVETSEGVVLDTTEKGEIVGLEIFEASQRLPIESLFAIEVEK